MGKSKDKNKEVVFTTKDLLEKGIPYMDYNSSCFLLELSQILGVNSQLYLLKDGSEWYNAMLKATSDKIKASNDMDNITAKALQGADVNDLDKECMKQKIADLTAVIEQLNRQISGQLVTKLESRDIQIGSLVNEIERLKKELREKEEENIKLKKQNSDFEDKYCKLRELYEQSEIENEKLKSQLKKQKHETDVFQEWYKRELKRNNVLEHTLKDVRYVIDNNLNALYPKFKIGDKVTAQYLIKPHVITAIHYCKDGFNYSVEWIEFFIKENELSKYEEPEEKQPKFKKKDLVLWKGDLFFIVDVTEENGQYRYRIKNNKSDDYYIYESELEGYEQPKFKVGDRVLHNDRIFTIKAADCPKGFYKIYHEDCGTSSAKEDTLSPLPSEPKFKVGDKVSTLKGKPQVFEVEAIFRNANNTEWKYRVGGNCWSESKLEKAIGTISKEEVKKMKAAYSPSVFDDLFSFFIKDLENMSLKKGISKSKVLNITPISPIPLQLSSEQKEVIDALYDNIHKMEDWVLNRQNREPKGNSYKYRNEERRKMKEKMKAYRILVDNGVGCFYKEGEKK